MSEKVKFFHVIMLDESGSMSSIQNETISGFNETVQQIKADAEENVDTQEHTVCLVTFNGHVDQPIWLESVDSLSEINTNSYSPGGMTALRDAIGQTIADLKKDLKDDLEGDDRVDIFMTIITDGHDTASREHSGSDIKEMIDSLDMDNDDSPWTVAFMGASADIVTAGQGMGFKAAMSNQFDADAVGTQAMFRGHNAGRSTYSKGISRGLGKASAEALYAVSSASGQAMTDEEVDEWIDKNAPEAKKDSDD